MEDIVQREGSSKRASSTTSNCHAMSTGNPLQTKNDKKKNGTTRSNKTRTSKSIEQYCFSNPALFLGNVNDDGDVKYDFSNPALAALEESARGAYYDEELATGGKHEKVCQKLRTHSSDMKSRAGVASRNNEESGVKALDDHVMREDQCGSHSPKSADGCERNGSKTECGRNVQGAPNSSEKDTETSSSSENGSSDCFKGDGTLPQKAFAVGATTRDWLVVLCFFALGITGIWIGLRLSRQKGGNKRSNLVLDQFPTMAPTALYSSPPFPDLGLDLGPPDEITGSWTRIGQAGPSELKGRGGNVGISYTGTRVAFFDPDSGNIGVYEQDEETYKWGALGESIHGTNSDGSGESLAFSGSGQVLAVGTPSASNSDNVAFAGIVRLHRWNGTDWGEMGQDLMGEQESEQFGSVLCLSTDGNTIAVGSWRKAINGSESVGETRIYSYIENLNKWLLLGSPLTGMNRGDQFGRSVSLSASGRRVAIGAPSARAEAGGRTFLQNPGHVRIFDFRNEDWYQFGVPITGLISGGLTGSKVSLSGDGLCLAISSVLSVKNVYTNPEIDGGEVRVYQNKGINWQQLGQVLEGDDSLAGTSVSLSFDGTKLASSANIGVVGTGGTTVYRFNPGANVWQILGELAHETHETKVSSLALSASGYRVIMAENTNAGAVGLLAEGSVIGSVITLEF